MLIRAAVRSAFLSLFVGASVAITFSACGGASNGRINGLSVDGSLGTFEIPEGGLSSCVPKRCADLGYTCGNNADTCGGVIDCGSCAGAEFCGGGGYSKCGTGMSSSTLDGGVTTCTPKTCSDYPSGTCGAQTDGCGSVTIACSSTDAGLCPAGQFCGGGGTSLCGSGSDASVSDAGGSGAPCVPKTCADFPAAACGQQGDGCGGLTVACNATDGGFCSGNQFCGGGGPGLCGGTLSADAGQVVSACVPKSCANLGNPCGAQGDGCGGMTAVCTTCPTGQFCGGGGPSQCGAGSSDAGNAADGLSPTTCVPKTCSNYPTGTCGPQSDGCGGVTANCGTCTSPAFCGGGGTPGMCGNSLPADAGTCVPKTCASYRVGTCGEQSDGCGGVTASCGTCTSPAFCGGGGTPGACGGNNGMAADGAAAAPCTPATCASLGYNCGQAGDGCGRIVGPCGTCNAPQVCGGGGQANLCGSNLACTGLCTQQKACAGTTTTTLTGTIVAGTISTYLPMGVSYGDPVPNVLVYIPNGTVQAFVPRSVETPAEQCTTCGADVTGDPLVETYSAFDGTFTLANVPVGNGIPLVIQLGRWRRQFTVAVTNQCAANQVNDPTMPLGILRMPRTQAEGAIPLTAISTGDVDAMECVLLKMGVDASEFTLPSTMMPKNGRVHMYQGNGAASSLGATPNEPALMGGGGSYNNYDQIVLPCWGVDPTTMRSTNAKSAAELANLVTYGDSGGHFFATHYQYAWLYNNNPYNTTAVWDVNHNVNIDSMTGIVNPVVPPAHPGVFVDWLNDILALSNATGTLPAPNPAQVLIDAARHDVDAVQGQSVEWIDGTDPADRSAMLLHYTFDTPVGQAAQCGHAIYSDFHVANAATGGDTCRANTDCSSGACNRGQCAVAQFPSEANLATYCGQTPMTAQEKILEYMIWDLASCVPAQPTSTCTPKTCASYSPGTCGVQGDGCGGLTANCGTCPTGQTCGGGAAAQCAVVDAGTCAPQTCSTYPVGTCGAQSDGCGGLTADCDNCPMGQTCGGGGIAGQCGALPTTSSCVPLTCAAYPGVCGQQSDGCAGLTADCNPCVSPQTCGGGGAPGQCGTPVVSCVPMTCAAYPNICGVQSDGCGGLTADCNPCTAPLTCGGAGVAGMCGSPPAGGCTPLTCAVYPAGTCGPQSDGCGGLTSDCNPCTAPQTCGGGGTAGQCGVPANGCVPKTCNDYPGVCGQQSDGCGGLTASCNPCTAPQTCGGGGVTGMCGSGYSCTPETCAKLGSNCGPAGDGCGGLLQCGTCTGGQTCTGSPGVCTGGGPR
jgi:hypothetical protein